MTCIFLCTFLFIGCKKHTITNVQANNRQALIQALSLFVNKTPNYVYDTLGEPDDYNVEVDKDNRILKGIITYKYLYNFKTKTYDCNIKFITDKEQDEIIGHEYSSEKCFSIILK